MTVIGMQYFWWFCKTFHYRMLSESFRSPFYKYYDEWKWDLAKIDFSKVHSEHDMLHRSAAELIRWGWTYDQENHSWSVSRSLSGKGNAKRPKLPSHIVSDSTQHESRNVFDIEFWRTIDNSLSENRLDMDQSQMLVDDPNSLRAE